MVLKREPNVDKIAKIGAKGKLMTPEMIIASTRSFFNAGYALLLNGALNTSLALDTACCAQFTKGLKTRARANRTDKTIFLVLFSAPRSLIMASFLKMAFLRGRGHISLKVPYHR